jgi:hypothetical protein
MILTLVALAALLTDPVALPRDAELRIDTARAWQHLRILAADSMRGRDTPSPELLRSAEYIASNFRAAGLEPLNGSYFHTYRLERLDLALPSTLRCVRGADTLEAEVRRDFIPFDQTGEASVAPGRVVFCGYGITAPEYAYDDYANVDVRGAVVMVLRGEPENDDTTRFNGKRFTRHASLTEKIRRARANGASALLVVDALRASRKPFVSGHPWPALYPNVPRSARPLVLPDTSSGIPVLHVGERVVNVLLDSLGRLRELTRWIDSTLTPRSFVVDGSSVSTTVRLDREVIEVRNVVGYLRGSTTPDEYAVIGAHYDHIGISKPVGGDSICNGADDNASGTTGLLLAAEALGSGSVRPQRSVVFVAFSGEEKGLLGSKAYVRASPLPLSNCVAMVNMDMIGRCEGNKLSIGGNERCPDLAAINAEENANLDRPFALAYDIEQYFFRSDQASFAMKRIPVIFYFTGEHADYHKVSDEVSKIDIASLVGITRLATRVLWRATRMDRTRYVPAGFEDP